MSHLDFLHRYADLSDDPVAFMAASGRPLPRTVWSNPLKPQAGVVDRLRGLGGRPFEPMPGLWRLPAQAKMGLDHAMGWVHTQDAESAFAADVLGARAGERVLDLCASPGGKTARIAVNMGDRGLVLANERSRGRLSPLRDTLERLGVTCAAVSQHDGRNLPVAQPFDRALVDAPCTCEGTSRKSKGGLPTPAMRDTMVAVQKGLLRRALRAVRPGGRLVYSTCTYAPEENELVLDALEGAELLPIEGGLTGSPGLTEWGGRSLRRDLVHARRIWPHHHDTGGFFVALLRRL